MVMEYEPGGDLYSLLTSWGYFPEDVGRQYTAEIILGLGYLHTNVITFLFFFSGSYHLQSRILSIEI